MGITQGKRRLYDAIEREQIQDVEKLLKKFPQNLNTPFAKEGNETPVTRAAWRGDIKMLEFLEKKGADLNLAVNGGFPAIQWAAFKGNLKLLKWLVRRGINIEVLDSEKMNPLDNQIIRGHYDCAKYLVKKGLKPKDFDFYEKHNEEYGDQRVNMEAFLESLEAGLDEMLDPIYVKKESSEEEEFDDPVIDPRQSFKEIMKKIGDFEAPKIVERQTLPPELQNKKQIVLKTAGFIFGPQIQAKKKKRKNT